MIMPIGIIMMTSTSTSSSTIIIKIIGIDSTTTSACWTGSATGRSDHDRHHGMPVEIPGAGP